MKKRLMCLILALCTLLSLAPAAIAEESVQSGFDNFKLVNTYPVDKFPDVAPEAWFFENVVSAYTLGLMKGNTDGTFNPDGSVTIAEAVTIAARLHSLYTTGSESFRQGTPWYQVYADYAYENGIFSGAYTLNNANSPATRWEFAMILASALPEEAYEPINTVADEAIPDVSLADVYGEAVYKLYRAGITIGSDGSGTFNPENSIRRSEVAAIVTRMAQPSLRQSITLGDIDVPGIFTVTFRLGYSGGGIYDKQLVAEGDRAREPRDPSRSGYTFEGWYTKAEGGKKFDFDRRITDDIMLYAHWAAEETPDIPDPVLPPQEDETPLFYVTFDLNHDGAEDPTVTELNKGDCVTAPQAPERADHTFSGWFTETEAITAFDFSTPIEADITHTARYAEYAAKTVNDFDDDDVVLQFTEDTDSNFGVLAEDVKQIGSAKFPWT